MRKIFLEDLPKKLGCGANKGKEVIDWKNSISYRIKFVYDNISGEFKILEYKPKGQKLKIEYDGKLYDIRTPEVIRCRLGRIVGIFTRDFKANIGDVFKDNNRDIVIIDREYRERNRVAEGFIENLKYYKYECNKCGEQNWKDEQCLLNSKSGCTNCCRVGRDSLIEGVTDIPTTHPWMVKYFQGGYEEAKLYTIGTNKKICPVCPDCGCVKNKPIRINDIYRRRSIGCGCGDGKSYGSKIMFSVLEQLGLDFKQEVKFNWCVFPRYKDATKTRFGYYDFVIDELDLIIEVDGEFHKIDNRMNGQSKEESTYIDEMKDKLAKENGYEVVRIEHSTTDYSEVKNNIINSTLSEILDLSQIDWSICEDFAMTNLMKMVTEHWNSKESWETTLTIAKLFHISDMGVRNYLKKATQLGLTNYDPKLESSKSGKKLSLHNPKRVEILKEGLSLGTYNSVLELANNSEKDFNCKLNKNYISSVARGERNQYKGYTFRYV